MDRESVPIDHHPVLAALLASPTTVLVTADLSGVITSWSAGAERVYSVVSLARAVGKTVIAEGVETVEQLDALRALGVDQAQGFLWSRGLPADEVELWLDANRAAPRPARGGVAARLVTRPAPSGGADEERILALHAEGASLHTIAAALNAEGRRTPAGPRWTTKTVARVVADQLAPRVAAER